MPPDQLQRPGVRAPSVVAFFAFAVWLLLITASPVGAQESAPDRTHSANAKWIIDLYAETLGRTADESGIDFWVSRLAGGGNESRELVANSFVYSTEGSRIEVQRGYADLLGRAPETGGSGFWTAYLQTHPVTVLRSNLIASDEYHQMAGGTNATWLEAVYVEVLERSVEPGGLRYWLDQMAAGNARFGVVWSVYLSPEALGNRADAYAQEILGRPLTPAERTTAVALIRAEDERALRAQLLASDEAFEPYLDAVGLLTLPGDAPVTAPAVAE